MLKRPSISSTVKWVLMARFFAKYFSCFFTLNDTGGGRDMFLQQIWKRHFLLIMVL